MSLHNIFGRKNIFSQSQKARNEILRILDGDEGEVFNISSLVCVQNLFLLFSDLFALFTLKSTTRHGLEITKSTLSHTTRIKSQYFPNDNVKTFVGWHTSCCMIIESVNTPSSSFILCRHSREKKCPTYNS